MRYSCRLTPTARAGTPAPLISIFALGFGLALWIFGEPAFAADADSELVVLEVRGLPLTPGQTVDGSKPLRLAEGQDVVLVSSSGTVINLHGPSDKPPIADQQAGGTDVGGALRSLVTQKIARSEAGVVRGGERQLVPPEPWLIDATNGGTRCLPANHPITFWRPGKTGPDAVLVVTPSDRSWRARADWPGSIDRVILPRSTPLPARSTYTVKFGEHEVSITLISLPPSLRNDLMRAAWMSEAGCDAQAKALLDTVAASTVQHSR